MKVTWLGQSGFIFECAGKRLIIDPFLSDVVEERQGLKRLMAPPVELDHLAPDYLFITHDHLDHFDPVALPQIHRAFPQAVIAGPQSVMQHAQKLHFNPSVLAHLPKGSTAAFGPFTVTTTPAYHSDPFAVGCILAAGNKTIYISGDTLYSDTLVKEVRHLIPIPPDVVFVVINGKLGNMNAAEAAELAAQLNAGMAIPMHYGMFAENTEDPSLFIAGCNNTGIPAVALILGKALSI